jgi:uncharacterized protein (TIRG00374 family)
MKLLTPYTGEKALYKRLGWQHVMVPIILALYWLALREVSFHQMLVALRQMTLPAVAILCGLNLMMIWSMCLRWGVILNQMGHALPWYWLCIYRLGANAVSYLTPGPHFGGEPLQMYLLGRRHRIPKEIAITSVAVDRFIELLVNLGVLLLTGICLLHLLIGDIIRMFYYAALLMVVVSMMSFLLLALARHKTPISDTLFWLLNRFRVRPRITNQMAAIKSLEGIASRILDQPLIIILVYGVSAFIQWFFIIAEFWFIYHMAGLTLNVWQLITLLGAARLSFLLPLPGAMGVLEASQVLVLGGLNLDPSLGLIACLVMRFRDVAVIGIGSALAIVWLSSDSENPHKLRRLNP